MLATYSTETLILTAMRELEFSASFLCALDGGLVSASRLNLALNGTKALEHHQTKPLMALVSELRDVAGEHAPFPVAFKNPALFRQLLGERRKQRAGQILQSKQGGGEKTLDCGTF